MDWITENYVGIAAFLFAVYGTARAFVALTPTPKDDAALEKVGVLVKTVAKILGLDLKQGRTLKKGETK